MGLKKTADAEKFSLTLRRYTLTTISVMSSISVVIAMS